MAIGDTLTLNTAQSVYCFCCPNMGCVIRIMCLGKIWAFMGKKVIIGSCESKLGRWGWGIGIDRELVCRRDEIA